MEVLRLAADALAPGTRVGGYVVDALRAEGGFALLYRGHDAATGEPVALKVLLRALSFHGTAVARFHREIDALGQLSHPNVVRVLSHGDLADGRPWLAMEWIEGGDLAAHLRARGSRSLAESVALVAPIADALDRAHSIGLVHRDVKGENVMLRTADGALTPTLVDFGIAHWAARDPAGHGLTSHSVVGSPCSMAPEQILGEAVDARTDVYALGVLLFHVVTGALPFRSPDPIELEEMHLQSDPPPPSALAPVPSEIDALVRRCMSKDPDGRPSSAREVADVLRAMLGARPIHAPLGAIHVEALADPTLDDAGDDVLDDIEAVVEIARAALAGAQLDVSMPHASAVLAIGEVARVRAIASDLVARLEGRTAPRVGVAISIHASTLDGELRATGAWVTRAPGTWPTDTARRLIQ